MGSSTALKTELYGWDIAVVIVYFLMVLGVGIWSSFKSQRESISGYFLAGRGMNWVLVGASLFASNMGTDHFIGLAGSGASNGIGMAGFELSAIFILLILGWVFVPVYISSGVFTMPEYLRKRFGGQRIRVYLAVLALLLSVFTKISADLYAGALFIKESLAWNLYASIAVLLIITVISTVGGGLTAVIWTDTIQVFLMLAGAMALSVMSFIKVGGYSELIRKFPLSMPPENQTGFNGQNESCSAVPDDYMHLLKSASSTYLPWPGLFFGLVFNSIWYWCSDQVIVQRALSSKDLSHAKAGCIMTGYLKVLPLFLLVFPGMASRILFPEIVACSKPEICKEYCGSDYGCSNIAYPLLVLHLMPTGGRGLMMSVMTASLVANLASIFNSSSTVFTIDIWQTIRRKKASELELLIVGRSFVVVLVAVSILWIPVIEASQDSQLFNYIQSVTSYLAPPVCAIYVLAITWERITEPGAFWGLIVGLGVGMARFIWEYSYTIPPCATGLPNPQPPIILRVHYLHFGCILFAVTFAVTVGVSYMTRPIPSKHLIRLTFWTRYSKEPRLDLDAMPMSPKMSVDGADNGGYDNADRPNGIEMVSMEKENADNDARKSDDVQHKRNIFLRSIYCICGVNSENVVEDMPKLTPEEEAEFASESIREKPIPGALCTINALIILTLAGFIWGYYA